MGSKLPTLNLGSIGLHSQENLMSILKTQMIVIVEQTIDATGHDHDKEEDACDNNGGLRWNAGGQTTK